MTLAHVGATRSIRNVAGNRILVYKVQPVGIADRLFYLYKFSQSRFVEPTL